MNSLMNLAWLSLVLLFLMTQPLTTAGRSTRSRRSRRSHLEEVRELEVDTTTPGPAADIPQTCRMARDATFCEQTLTGNPDSKGKDLRQLSLLALDMAKSKGVEISNAVTERLQNEQAGMFATVNNALNVFLERYTVTLGSLEKAIAAFSSPNLPFDDVKHWISGGMSNSEVCRVAIIEAKPDDVDLLNEGRSNTEFYKLCDNALSVVTTFQFVTWTAKKP